MRWRLGLPFEDELPGLAERLLPEADVDQVVERLFWIYRRWAVAEARGIFVTEDLETARRQLEALRKALRGLQSRAAAHLAEALGTVMGERFRLCGNDDVLVGPLSGLVNGLKIALAFDRAVDQAIDTLESRPRGRRGRLSKASREAVRELVDLFCELQSCGRPYFDTTLNTVRRNDALVFARECLLAWRAEDVDAVAADDLYWSLPASS
jgi:hypothetical protein